MLFRKITTGTIVRCGIYILFTAAVGSAQYVNPLKGDLGVHDPVLIKEAATGTYRIYCTGRNVGSKTSQDRITWRFASSGLSAPSWVRQEVPGNNGSDFWAPDIMYRENKYWLYYSVSTFGQNTSAIGLATSPSLSDPDWTDQGVVVKSVSSDSYNCIDPAIFEDDDGKVWLSFGSFWSGIKLVEVDPETGKPPSTRPELISIAARRPTSLGIEAPYICKWGYYYLFVSWDKCCDGCNSTYKIVVGRSDNITGPYVDKDGTDMLDGGGEVIDSGDDVRRGPGHNGIFIDNDTLFCVNHYYACNSLLQIRPLFFDDGWPSFTGSKTEPPVVEVKKSAAPPAAKPVTTAHIRVAFPFSRIKDIQPGRKMFSITGKAIPTGYPGRRHQAPRGIVIIDEPQGR